MKEKHTYASPQMELISLNDEIMKNSIEEDDENIDLDQTPWI